MNDPICVYIEIVNGDLTRITSQAANPIILEVIENLAMILHGEICNRDKAELLAVAIKLSKLETELLRAMVELGDPPAIAIRLAA